MPSWCLKSQHSFLEGKGPWDPCLGVWLGQGLNDLWGKGAGEFSPAHSWCLISVCGICRTGRTGLGSGGFCFLVPWE